MDKFAFLLKTYGADLMYVRRLIDSFEHYNKDSIKLFVVVDGKELDRFDQEFSNKLNVFLIKKEDIPVRYAEGDKRSSLSEGYVNQEIVKLAFWKLGLCQNYSCIDSELVFIREFGVDEFMYDEHTPYTVLFEDKELLSNPNYYNSYWVERQKKLDIIQRELGITNKHVLTCHGMQTFNSKVLAAMEKEYLEPRNMTYLDLIKKSPYEFSWYNYFLQKYRTIEIIPCEPHFKTYHMEYQQVMDHIQGITIDSLKRAYCGIVINSNYARNRISSYDDVDVFDWETPNYEAYKVARALVKRSRWCVIKTKIKRDIKHILMKTDKNRNSKKC